MASELALSIQIGAVVGGAVAALGSVTGQLRRMGLAAQELRNLRNSMDAFIGPRTPGQIAAATAQYERLGKTLERLEAQQLRLKRVATRRDDLRADRQAMRGDFFDTVAVGAAVAAPVKLAIDFESAMADVRKVVDFEKPDGFKRLGDDILSLTRTLPLTATELAKITASGGQLGVAEKDLLSFTKVIAKMSTAFDMAAEDAGDSMAKLANVYQIPILKIGQLGDAINELSNKSPAKARDIVMTLGRIGGVAKQFGLNELQASALSNAYVALGKAPEVAGTAINGMLTKLGTADKQGKKFQQALAEVGLSARGLKEAIAKDAQGALVDFLKKMETIPGEKRMGILVDLFGLQYADDVAVLAGSVKTYTDSIDVLNSKSTKGSMDKEFATRAATTGNNLKLLKNGMMELGINIGSVVLPALNELVDSVRPVVASMTEWAKANPGVVSGLMKAFAGVAALKITMLGLGYSLNLVTSGWTWMAMVWAKAGATIAWLRAGWLMQGPAIMGRLALSWAALGRVALSVGSALMAFGKGLAMTFAGPFMLIRMAVVALGRALLMNPIGLIITGIAVAGYLIYKNWSVIAPFLGRVWGMVKSTFLSAWTWIKGLPQSFMEMGRNLIDGLISGVTSRITAARDRIVSLGQSIKGWFTSVLGIQSPSRVFMGYGQNIGQGAQQGIMASVPGVKTAVGALSAVALGGALGGAMAAQPMQLAKPALQMRDPLTLPIQLQQPSALPALSSAQRPGMQTPEQPRQLPALAVRDAVAAPASSAQAVYNITFSPSITVSGSAKDAVPAQIQQGLQLSMRDLEVMLRRLQAEQSRKAH